MSFVIHGIAVASGIAIGRAHLFAQTSLDVTHYAVAENKLDAEVERFNAAIGDLGFQFAEALRLSGNQRGKVHNVGISGSKKKR